MYQLPHFLGRPTFYPIIIFFYSVIDKLIDSSSQLPSELTEPAFSHVQK